ncbi:8638_t:CDS:2 [Acaulospora morrowiae]|uniref:8638_t:CDS:1 n=1 Tax=Acaulospora morrowiae TaxID=94023 RepID=A0A9N9CAK0_9GLOM|nr:8638_t:CDS:2 [Acaulospora morrowiae]
MTEVEEAPQERHDDLTQEYQEFQNRYRNPKRTGLCGNLCFMCVSIILALSIFSQLVLKIEMDIFTQHVNDGSIILLQSVPKGTFSTSYIVHVGGTPFQFSEFSLKRDSPNLFTETFFGENDQKKGTIHSMCVDRDPQIFAVIARYLRGYSILPLSPANLPLGMSYDTFRRNLSADIHFYKLPNLIRHTLPVHKIYKSPFTEDWLMEVCLSAVKAKDLHLDKEIIRFSGRDAQPIVQFHVNDVVWDIFSSQQSHFQFLQPSDAFIIQSILKAFRPQYNQGYIFYACEDGPSLFNIDGVEMLGKEVYQSVLDKSQELIKPLMGKCVRLYLNKLIFMMRIPDYSESSAITILPLFGKGHTQLFRLASSGGLNF